MNAFSHSFHYRGLEEKADMYEMPNGFFICLDDRKDLMCIAGKADLSHYFLMNILLLFCLVL